MERNQLFSERFCRSLSVCICANSLAALNAAYNGEKIFANKTCPAQFSCGNSNLPKKNGLTFFGLSVFSFSLDLLTCLFNDFLVKCQFRYFFEEF